jgi:chromate transporter
MPESTLDDSRSSVPERNKSSLSELALLFLRLGAIAFGGPAAHVAMMEDEVVRRRRWLSRDQFLDLLGASNLIPGPNSTELAIHLGYLRAGWAGLLVAGACFILPAAVIVAVIAWAYVKFGTLPQATGILYGVKPVIIAIVLQALWRFGQTALKTRALATIGLISLILNAIGVNELIVLAGAGVIVGVGKRISRRRKQDSRPTIPLILTLPTTHVAQVLGASSATATSFGLWPLFLFFLKVGSVLFGSGYVLLAFLRADLVERWHWMSESQLIDAIAVGQVTPGPVFTTATFIGYVLGGAPGAVLATIGIFLPAFFFVGISGPLVPRLRRSVTAGAVLDGVNVASLALMAVVTWQLGRAALIDLPTAILFLASALLLILFRLNSSWLVLGGALVGLLVFVFGKS